MQSSDPPDPEPDVLDTENTLGQDDDKVVLVIKPGSTHASTSPYCLPKRVIIAILGHLSESVCYADRTSISLAIIPMAEQYNWGDDKVGWILSSFFVGYACTQILGGWSSVRWGAKSVLGGGVFLWSLFTLLTPGAAAGPLSLLLAVRMGMGLGEGVAIPAVHQLSARWSPREERSRFISACTSGQFTGTVGAMASSPLVALSWPAVFYVWGAVGWLWVAAWWWLAASSPDEDPNVSDHERKYIIQGRDGCGGDGDDDGDDVEMEAVAPGKVAAGPAEGSRPQASEGTPWWRFVSSSAFIAICCSHFAHNWGWFLLLSWLPKLLVSRFGVDVATSGALLLVPYMITAFMSNLGGHIADLLLKRRWQLATVRKLMQSIAFAGPASAYLALMWVPGTGVVRDVDGEMGGKEIDAGAGETASDSPGTGVNREALLVVVLMTFALGTGAFSHSGFWANIVDIGPNHCGTLCGISNTVATIPGILANITTGYILKTTGSWRPAFAVAVFVYGIGAVIFTRLCKGHQVFA